MANPTTAELSADFWSWLSPPDPVEATVRITSQGVALSSILDGAVLPPVDIELATSGGAFAVDLPRNDDPAWLPNDDWAYLVTAVFADWDKMAWLVPLDGDRSLASAQQIPFPTSPAVRYLPINLPGVVAVNGETGEVALSALDVGALPLTGGTLTGDLQIEDPGVKGYRLRRSGGALDLDATGAKLFISVFSGTNFDGTQRTYLVLESGASIAQAVGRWEYRQTPDGATRHVLDAVTGSAAIGSKNGLANIQFGGFKNSAGAPAAGDWLTGDVVLATDGWYRCTAGGTPGVWAEIV